MTEKLTALDKLEARVAEMTREIAELKAQAASDDYQARLSQVAAPLLAELARSGRATSSRIEHANLRERNGIGRTRVLAPFLCGPDHGALEAKVRVRIARADDVFELEIDAEPSLATITTLLAEFVGKL